MDLVKVFADLSCRIPIMPRMRVREDEIERRARCVGGSDAIGKTRKEAEAIDIRLGERAAGTFPPIEHKRERLGSLDRSCYSGQQQLGVAGLLALERPGVEGLQHLPRASPVPGENGRRLLVPSSRRCHGNIRP